MTSKGRMQATGASSEVQSLVRSVLQHKKFKQLTMYSLNSLEKVLKPPHSGWEANAVAAFECGAVEAVSAVLALHKVSGYVWNMGDHAVWPRRSKLWPNSHHVVGQPRWSWFVPQGFRCVVLLP
jgi:hypothetical protein